MDVTIKEIAEKLKEYDNYCIVYHIVLTIALK